MITFIQIEFSIFICYKRCQQPRGWPQGLFDISNCQHGFPALVSLPHFLKAEQCLRDVEGLKPNRSLHDFEMNVFPVSVFTNHRRRRVTRLKFLSFSVTVKTLSIVYEALMRQCFEYITNSLTYSFERQLLGIPVEPALRIQINVRVRRQFSSSSPAIVYPVLWQEIVSFAWGQPKFY